MISAEILLKIMPNLKEALCDEYFPFIQQAMDEFEINTPLRESAFLAQIAHESGEFRYLEELWGPTDAQRRYEPPSKKANDLGNTHPGDGKRFKGRGAIQLTGRANYKKFGDLLSLDLPTHPEWVATPQVAFRVSAAFWKLNGLNELADQQKFETMTRRINGGLTGLTERLMFYNRAKTLCGA
ncbi:MAG: glycoside hydrolase family 19 protein [Methylococcaceae bacterium]|nr:glycoside hydrolase family 19 protein [Methylococcaceae bacterium]